MRRPVKSAISYAQTRRQLVRGIHASASLLARGQSTGAGTTLCKGVHVLARNVRRAEGKGCDGRKPTPFRVFGGLMLIHAELGPQTDPGRRSPKSALRPNNERRVRAILLPASLLALPHAFPVHEHALTNQRVLGRQAAKGFHALCRQRCAVWWREKGVEGVTMSSESDHGRRVPAKAA